MPHKTYNVNKTIVSNSIPVFLSIILFILLISFIILPFIKEALLSQKKDAVKKMIESAYSIVDNAYIDFNSGILTEEEAQDKALSIVNDIRYDEGMKNYFWINTIEENHESLLIVHPYRKDLVGKNVLFLQDPFGVYIFRDMVDLVQEKDEGYVSYHWQYMDDSDRIEPKISFIKHYAPWNWIIGTGLYLDDINREINQITNNIRLYIVIVLAIIVILLIYNSYITIRTEKEKNTAQRRLYDSESYLHSLFELLPLALFSCDQNWAIRNCNARAGSLLERSSESLPGRTLYSLIPEIIIVTENTDFQSIRDHEKLFEKQTITVNERQIIANIKVFALQYENYPEYVILIDDVSIQVQKENQLIQAQKMETVGNLVGGIAHDFNNILGGIIGVTSLLLNKCENFESLTEDKLRKDLNLIDDAGNRAADMIQQLLSLVRKQDSLFIAEDLNLAIRNVYKICSNSFDKCIDIKSLPYETPAIAMVNSTMITQVLLNLCVNANHAMTIMRKDKKLSGGTLTLQITKGSMDKDCSQYNPEAAEGDYWCILVRDTGVGIEKENLVKIFEPFFTTKKKGQGTGLGLSMVYNIISQHRGLLDIQSEPGQGTVVKILLPVYQEETPDDGSDSIVETLPEGRGTVLVIDDDEIIRQLCSDILKSCGYDILEAINGTEGIRVFRENKDCIDLIYLDLILPGKSGAQVLHSVRKMNSSVKILLSSGSKKNKQLKELMTEGADGFLQKPFTAYELSRKIHDLLNS